MNTLNIRRASLNDAPTLLAIYAPYVIETSVTFEYEVPSLAEFTGRMERTLARYPYLVAEADGELIGYAYASAFKGRPAYDWAVETSIYIRKDCRRSGAGRALYAALENCLRAQNILNSNACIAYKEIEDEHLTLDSVRFHEREGYRMVGVFHQCGYKFNRWYDMVWMEKLLGEHLPVQPPVIPFPEINMDI